MRETEATATNPTSLAADILRSEESLELLIITMSTNISNIHRIFCYLNTALTWQHSTSETDKCQDFLSSANATLLTSHLQIFWPKSNITRHFLSPVTALIIICCTEHLKLNKSYRIQATFPWLYSIPYAMTYQQHNQF